MKTLHQAQVHGCVTCAAALSPSLIQYSFVIIWKCVIILSLNLCNCKWSPMGKSTMFLSREDRCHMVFTFLATPSHMKFKCPTGTENQWIWNTKQFIKIHSESVSSVPLSCPTLCNPVDCRMPGFPIHHQLPELAQTHVHWVGDAIQPSYPLLSPSPPAFNLSQHQGLFQGVGSSHQGAKLLELHFSISPSNEYSGLISFRMDWFDLLAVQGTLKSLLQHYSSKASILRHPAFFTVQFSCPYTTTGKTIALTRRTVVSNVMSAF